MAIQWQTFPIEFRGGLISNLSPLQQGTNAVGSATILQNFEPNKEGGYTKIKGFSKFDNNQVTGSGEIKGVKVVNSTKILAARKNSNNRTQFFKSTGSGWTALTENTSSTEGNKIRSATFNLDGTEKIVFVDGVNYPCIYNTSNDSLTHLSSSNSSDIQGSNHITVFKSTVFYGKGNKLYFTAPFTADDFSPANNAGVINTVDNITGLITFREQLIIFTERSIKRLTGNTAADFLLQPITERIGCIDPDTVQEFGGDVIYLAPDGIRLLSATDRIGDFGLDVPSDVIAKDFKNFTLNSNSFCSLVLKTKAQYRIFNYQATQKQGTSRGLIVTKFSSQGSSNVGFSTIKGIKVNVADSKSVGSSELTVIGNDSGYIYKLEDGHSFDGEVIDSVYESPYMPINDPEIRKTFYKLTVFAEPTSAMSFDVKLKYNFQFSGDTQTLQPTSYNITNAGSATFVFGGGQAIYGSANYGLSLKTEFPINVQGSGTTVSLRIEDKSTNPAFTLDTAVLEFANRDRK